MTTPFADTSYYLALINAEDELHARAKEITPDVGGTLVTTAWVLTELVDALSRPPNRAMAVEFVRDWYGDPRVTVVPPSQELFDAGLDLFARREDKEWSLTDCISFVVMREQGITEALTGDRHFEQAGFNILLK
jgi:predicted nucleic acid-binding protein